MPILEKMLVFASSFIEVLSCHISKPVKIIVHDVRKCLLFHAIILAVFFATHSITALQH